MLSVRKNKKEKFPVPATLIADFHQAVGEDTNGR